ncbi:hypothetical protein [Pseudomonas asplenii]|uniref:hypothetical protein n=1 Tax=Pseudomonas asplenii TaxID=53407 RepID=UPI00223401F0|nr:hypothetical protein [Pseudomonas asplenii]UZE29697.1 hypothetical protein LOY63_02805 [Pseudomonas asplenii]
MKTFVWIVLILSLCGCSFNSRSSAPTLWTDGIMLEQRKVAVDDEHAKVIMRSTSFSLVEFSVRRENDPDQRPDELGTASKPMGKGFGWLNALGAALYKDYPQVEMQAEAGLKLQVLGYWSQRSSRPAPGYEHRSSIEKVYNAEKNKWEDKPVDIPMVSSFKWCGSVGTTFVPLKGRTYLVEYALVDDGCRQQVYDITRPEQRIPVTLLEDFPPSSDKIMGD